MTIKNAEDLTEALIGVSGYMMNIGVGEVEVYCGKLRVKAIIDLIEKESEETDDGSRD